MIHHNRTRCWFQHRKIFPDEPIIPNGIFHNTCNGMICRGLPDGNRRCSVCRKYADDNHVQRDKHKKIIQHPDYHLYEVASDRRNHPSSSSRMRCRKRGCSNSSSICSDPIDQWQSRFDQGDVDTQQKSRKWCFTSVRALTALPKRKNTRNNNKLRSF